MGLPPGLKRALSEVDPPGPPHVGGKAALPHPALRIRGIDGFVSLPMSPGQHEELAAFALSSRYGRVLDSVDDDVCECVEVAGSEVSFANPEWVEAMEELKKKAAEGLRVPKEDVECRIRNLTVYGKGGYFKSRAGEDVFATMVVQMPSMFGGGELVVRGDEGGVYEGGTKDGSCVYSGYYTAVFADADCELMPVVDGLRVVLVYDLVWRGKGRMPCSTPCLDDVVSELKVLQEGEENGAWKLTLGMEHRYAMGDLMKKGVKLLWGRDRDRVVALTLAAKSAGMGELEVLFCGLSRRDTESKYCAGEFAMGVICVEAACRADGSRFDGDLEVVDWSREDDVQFYYLGEERVSGGPDQACVLHVNYQAVSVVLWPKNKTVELLCGSERNVSYLLNGARPHEYESLTNRLLQKMQAPALASRVGLVFEFSVLHGLAEQASTAFILGCELDAPSKGQILQALDKLGWEAFGNAAELYLCPDDMLSVTEPGMYNRLDVLHGILGRIPERVAYAALCKIVSFLRKKRSRFVPAPTTGAHGVDVSVVAVWKDLFEVFESLHNALFDKGCMSALDDLVFELIGLSTGMPEFQLAAVERALECRGNRPGVGVLSKLWEAVKNKHLLLRMERFTREAEHFIEHKVLPPQYCDNDEADDMPTVEDWYRFFSFTVGVLSEDVRQEFPKSFQQFLDTFANLEQQRLDAILAATSSLDTPPRNENPNAQNVLAAIRDAVTRAQDLALECELKANVAQLESLTEIEPPNFPVSYDATNFKDMPSIKTFLEGTTMTFDLTGYRNTSTARKVLDIIRFRLPNGVEGTAGGSGNRSYIRLTKPFIRERMEWVGYQKNKDKLDKVQEELQLVQKRLRGVHDEKEEPPKKKAKLEDRLVEDVEVIDSEAVKGRRVSPTGIRDFIILD